MTAKFLVRGKLVDGKGNELNADGTIKTLAAPTADTPVKLPADAKERLLAVKGVGEKLADEVIEALNAPVYPIPTEPQE